VRCFFLAGVLIAGILGERLLKWLKNTGFFGGESGSVSR